MHLLEEEGARKGIDISFCWNWEGHLSFRGKRQIFFVQTIKKQFLSLHNSRTICAPIICPKHLQLTVQRIAFVKALFSRQTNTGDLVEDALYYGLDALKQKQVTPSWISIEQIDFRGFLATCFDERLDLSGVCSSIFWKESQAKRTLLPAAVFGCIIWAFDLDKPLAADF